ncbi:MAG TPA: hypothetical protein VE093_05470, partial [Polyangiaceae bacterium]|nr:hypothetical protein [Polyangiaceae bacterium]
MFPLRYHPRSAWLQAGAIVVPALPSGALRKAQAPRKVSEVLGELGGNRPQTPRSRRLRPRDQILGPLKLGELPGR